MMNAIKRFFANLFSKKTLDLDNDGKIETLREEVQGVFSQFKNMHDKLTNVNSELDNVIMDELTKQQLETRRLEQIVEDSNRKIRESNERAGRAKMEMDANKHLQSKVAEFLPVNIEKEVK